MGRAAIVANSTFFKVAKERYERMQYHDVLSLLRSFGGSHWKATAKQVRAKKGDWFTWVSFGDVLLTPDNLTEVQKLKRPHRVTPATQQERDM